MDQHDKLEALISLAESLGLEVRIASRYNGLTSRAGGAMVKLRGREILFLDSDAPLVERIDVVASALRHRPELAERYLQPDIRQTIEAAGDQLDQETGWSW